MALDINMLASEIEAEVDKLKGVCEAGNYKKSYYIALATALINHIKENASVNGGVCTHAGAINGGKIS